MAIECYIPFLLEQTTTLDSDTHNIIAINTAPNILLQSSEHRISLAEEMFLLHRSSQDLNLYVFLNILQDDRKRNEKERKMSNFENTIPGCTWAGTSLLCWPRSVTKSQ